LKSFSGAEEVLIPGKIAGGVTVSAFDELVVLSFMVVAVGAVAALL
jgi:hypothetical protein